MIPLRKLPGRPVIAVGVAVAALLTGAGVAMAATSGSSAPGSRSGLARSGQAAAAPSLSPSRVRCQIIFRGRPPFLGPALGFPPGPGFGWGLGLGGDLFGAIHGQFVVPKAGGGYQTVDVQRGSVTAVSTTSITVKSSDGFTKTYRVTSSTIVAAQREGIASVKSGQQVMVVATVSGSTATAVSVIDLSALPALRISALPALHIAMPQRCPRASWKVAPAPSAN